MVRISRYFGVAGLSLCTLFICSETSDAQYFHGYNLQQRLEHVERTIQDMRDRIHQLEQQVRDLSQAQQPATPAGPVSWTCHVDAGGNSYSATRPGRGEATARVMEKCQNGITAFFCKQKNVVCDPN